jgi:dTDP-4-amino-4,6-dideoxy-D-galactose acyltransferase
MIEANARMVPVALSALDEARFGLRTARAMNLSANDLPQVMDFCQDERVKFLIARCPVADLKAVHLMEGLGFHLMDTLVYFRRDLVHSPLPQRRAVSIRSITEADVDAVGEIARQSFHNYDSHYHADPRLDRPACDAIYVDWAMRSCREKNVADDVLVAEMDGIVVGFLTLKILDSGDADGRLYAVAPVMQGRGIGQALLIDALYWCRQHSLSGMIISTQITNLASQISWARVGFIPSQSFYTLHKWFEEK